MMRTGDWAGVIRSKGFFWVASQPRWVFLWSQAGGAAHYEVTGQWWDAAPAEEWPADAEAIARIRQDWDPRFGDRRQQLVVIGRDIDEQALRAALDACLASEDEIDADDWRVPSGAFRAPDAPAHSHAG